MDHGAHHPYRDVTGKLGLKNASNIISRGCLPTNKTFFLATNKQEWGTKDSNIMNKRTRAMVGGGGLLTGDPHINS